MQPNENEIDKEYQRLNTQNEVLYHFIMHYNEYIYSTHKYGEMETLTMIEVHTLSYIDDNPGTTPAELISYWDKTKGAISQILNKLERMELIRKEKKDGNKKSIFLYITEYGRKISLEHKYYDIKDIDKTRSQILKNCNKEELAVFFKVLGIYNDVINNDFDNRKNKK